MIRRIISGEEVDVIWNENLDLYELHIGDELIGSVQTASDIRGYVKAYVEGKKRKKTLKIMKEDGAFDPVRGHDTDAGLDLRSREEKPIWPGGSEFFDTGIHIMLPDGYYGKIESRSGLNKNHNVVCCGGVIDQGYTGSIGIVLYNFGRETLVVHPGDKIAQLVIQPYIAPKIEFVESLEETERGGDGFGSTGV